MVVRIRLARFGRIREPFYRVGVWWGRADSQCVVGRAESRCVVGMG